MRLNDIRDNQGARKPRKRIGRGIGSTKGKTAGQGQKGQKARTGVSLNGFEGGQNPFYRRLPKRGFHNPSRVDVSVVNADLIEAAIKSGKLKAGKVGVSELIQAGLINRKAKIVKLLARGQFTSSIEISVHKASEAAVEAVKKAKGSVTLINA